MRIVLTSFRDAKNWKGTTCSIARWQPNWSEMPEFPVNIKPIYHGKPMVHLLPEDFRVKYEEILKNKEEELIEFFSRMENDETLVLCCWCNMDRQKGYEKLYCHRILLGYWIEEHFKFAIVKYSDGAEKPIWRRNDK